MPPADRRPSPALPRPALRPVGAIVALAALAACVPNQAAPVVEGTPAPAATASAPDAAASAPASPAATPGPASAGPAYREDFDGEKLDPTRWKAFEREGRVLVRDGKLELLVPGVAGTAPMVVPTADQFPATGPFYVDTRYELLTAGRALGFSLDYLPPMDPADPGLTEPFMRWVPTSYGTQLQFQTEAGVVQGVLPAEAFAPRVPHRFRLEFDGTDGYRAILDGAEIARFASRRRPTRIWFGPWPNRPVVATAWTTVRVDAIEAGVLGSPEPAEPLPTPSPGASASPSASPSTR